MSLILNGLQQKMVFLKYNGNDFEIRNLRVYRPREDKNAFFGQLTNYG